LRDQFLPKINDKNSNLSSFINKENFIFLFLFPIISIFQFNYLNFYLFTILVLNQIIKFNFRNYQKIILKFYIFVLILKRYLVDIPNEKFLNSLNNDIFWDTQLFLLQLRCNANDVFSYNFQLSGNFISCLEGGVGYDGPVNIGFGPLSKILKFSGDIWFATIFISILVGIIVLIFLIKTNISKKNLFILSLLLSPSFIFLLDTMNLDIVIFLIFVIYIYFLKNWNITFLTVFSILSMLKLYPVGFIAGIFIYNFISKDLKNSIISAGFLTANLFYIFYNYVFNNFSLTQKPFAPVRTYGLQSDSEAIRRFYGFEFFRTYHLILLVLMFYFVLLLLKKESILKKNITDKLDKRIFIITTPVVVVISLFANYSYKLVFIFIVAAIIHKNISNFEKTIMYFFFFTNPLIMIFGISGGTSIIEFSLFLVNRLCGYYLTFLIIKNFYYIVKKALNKNSLIN
tara:strand:+ start:3819 stop:5189 length:1371 start_codon:yes stop_codon:yes gene_type:complete